MTEGSATVLMKVIFCDASSNRNLTHIINQSSLIEIYWSVHININDNFAVTWRSAHHAPADLENTLKGLQEEIQRQNCHSYIPGSVVSAKVPNILMKGITEFSLLKGGQVNDPVMENETLVLDEDDFDALWLLSAIGGQSNPIWLCLQVSDFATITMIFMQ